MSVDRIVTAVLLQRADGLFVRRLGKSITSDHLSAPFAMFVLV